MTEESTVALGHGIFQAKRAVSFQEKTGLSVLESFIPIITKIQWEEGILHRN